MIGYDRYPRPVVEDIARLRRRIAASGLPPKDTDTNLLIGTWNIRTFGRVYESWDESPRSPKRNLRALANIAEVVRRLDIVAVQEVKRDTSGIRLLVDEFLGPNWGLILSDVTAGSEGNEERLAFVYDRRRVQPSGLVGEIVLPPTAAGDPVRQFARTPYLVGFRCREEPITLLTAHIRYGDRPEGRVEELEALAEYVAVEIRERSRVGRGEEANLIVLGDFNIDRRGDNPLFRAFVSTGLVVPPQLMGVKTTYGREAKYYDHVAWFMGELGLNYRGRAGAVDFAGAVYQGMGLGEMSYRVSDHFPLWVEFGVDRSAEQMAATLGVDPGMPDPLGTISD
jgi:hypothetical protein